MRLMKNWIKSCNPSDSICILYLVGRYKGMGGWLDFHSDSLCIPNVSNPTVTLPQGKNQTAMLLWGILLIEAYELINEGCFGSSLVWKLNILISVLLHDVFES